MNAANEVLVERFFWQKIIWNEIGIQPKQLMSQHKVQPIDMLESILAINAQA